MPDAIVSNAFLLESNVSRFVLNKTKMYWNVSIPFQFDVFVVHVHVSLVLHRNQILMCNMCKGRRMILLRVSQLYIWLHSKIEQTSESIS